MAVITRFEDLIAWQEARIPAQMAYKESIAEFARFLGMARRSAVEVQPLLYVALDAVS